MNETEIVEYIDKNKEEFIEILTKLIQTDSYNPPGNERNLAKEIGQILDSNNIYYEIDEFGENRANITAFLDKDIKEHNLLYNAHMDVVPPGIEKDWKKDPLSAYNKRNKYIYGRGAADMKGGLAAMIVSMLILKRFKVISDTNLILSCVADEETGGSKGTKWILENKLSHLNIDFCVIGEPSGLNPLPKAIILGERGHLQVKIIANGKSCHASMPSMGKNAILMINEFISNLSELDKYIPEAEPPLTKEELKVLVESVFPSREIFEKILSEQEMLRAIIDSLVKPTRSITMINGGIKENVVPDQSSIVIDFRLLPGQNSNQILEALKKLIEDIGYQIKSPQNSLTKNINFEIEIIHNSEGSYWSNWRNSELLKTFFEYVKFYYKQDPFYFLYPASADAHYIRNNGICAETILFGPGNAGTAHATDEFIEIEDFIKAIKVFTVFALKCLIRNKQ